MTTLVAWVACDNAKQTAVYLASDSRLSWNKNTRWDRGRKIFSSEKYADIFGYCGDVLFCSQQLSQIISYIDSCKTFENKFQPCERSEIIFDLVKNSFGTYPKEFVLPTFSIIYLTRHEKYDFHGYLFSWNKSSGWSKKKIKYR